MQNIAHFMLMMLTQHPSYSFSCLTASLCVFCRNEENKTKIKQFGQELKELCKKEAMVATIAVYGRDHSSKHGGRLCSQSSVWPRPQPSYAAIVIPHFQCGCNYSLLLQTKNYNMQCGRDHSEFVVMITRRLQPRNFPFVGLFWPIFQWVYKCHFNTLLGFELGERRLPILGFYLLERRTNLLGLDFLDLVFL